MMIDLAGAPIVDASMARLMIRMLNMALMLSSIDLGVHWGWLFQ